MVKKEIIGSAIGGFLGGVILTGAICSAKIKEAKTEGTALKEQYEEKLNSLKDVEEESQSKVNDLNDKVEKLKKEKEDLEKYLKMVRDGLEETDNKDKTALFIVNVLESLRNDIKKQDDMEKIRTGLKNIDTKVSKLGIKVDNTNQRVKSLNDKIISINL